MDYNHQLQLFDFFMSTTALIVFFVALLNLGRILTFFEFFISFLANSVQDLFSYVTMKVNGGYGYGKKQGNFKRARSYRKRR